MKIALYSGSFNPIHNGHIAVAEAALANGFDEVWMVVSPQNPHKKEEELWPFETRMKMVELAIANHPGLKASDCENLLPRPSYTINTLKYLQELHPSCSFRLLIGGDNLLKFQVWKEHQRIVDEFGLIIYPRSGSSFNFYEHHPNVLSISAPLLNISSSDIRKRLEKKEPVSGLVSTEVEKFILQNIINNPNGTAL
ncbi:MAG: nicotinate (nicotinamide) nucleotide adenylyltransferase [Prolixibacteraceae bacterium]|jgi:nicotinate-nucleotide adenylyltransferase|nr:nicotinate (nicotinamide) nucleotide adenylyltransferase [Prolixibacteraceae bacterium]